MCLWQSIDFCFFFNNVFIYLFVCKVLRICDLFLHLFGLIQSVAWFILKPVLLFCLLFNLIYCIILRLLYTTWAYIKTLILYCLRCCSFPGCSVVHSLHYIWMGSQLKLTWLSNKLSSEVRYKFKHPGEQSGLLIKRSNSKSWDFKLSTISSTRLVTWSCQCNNFNRKH